MVKEKSIIAFIKELSSIYHAEYGASKAKLESWRFSYTLCAEHENLMNIIQKSVPEEEFGEALEFFFGELVARGFLKEAPDVHFHLTEAGYSFGRMSIYEKFINYFNINQGINTIIAILSFVISIVALYFSIKQP